MPTLKAIYARVLGAQSAPDAIPLTLQPGDIVQVGREHPDRPGYVWVEDGQISSGWVPQDLLDDSTGSTRAKAEYCSAELEVAAGDQVRIIWKDPAHGAWWVEDKACERGWVREELLQADEVETEG